MTAPSTPAIPGAIPQAAKTCATPCQPQCICFIPTEAVPAPTSPPIIECVVLTGSPKRVAMVRKEDDPMMAHIMASMRTAGSASYRWGSMILSRTVAATREPTLTDPANSMQAAMTIACLSVRDREETDEANELATSLAPSWVRLEGG